MNLFTDSMLNPSITAMIEMVLWTAIIASTGSDSFAGYSKYHYLSYALWASFFGRIAANWMYEFRMIEEIDSGSVNSILARPISFYEYYLSQFLGYKLLCLVTSLCVPVVIMQFFPSTTMISRIPAAILLLIFYLTFIHTLAFTLAGFAFFYNKVHSFTGVKNLCIWVLAGDLFPLDLLPGGIKQIVISLPFASGTYIPVGYITGRLSFNDVLGGFLSVAAGLIVMLPISFWLWNRGRMSYSGTGA